MVLLKRTSKALSVFDIESPQDGGWSLFPMENLLRGLRNHEEPVALELFGRNGVVCHNLRTNNGRRLEGVLHAYFPQARLVHRIDMPGEEVDAQDWLRLEEDEYALVVPVYLERESYLPLQTFDDSSLFSSKVDPLAGVIGVLSSSTRRGADEGDRLGMRMVIRAADEKWSGRYQQQMQARRDGDDRENKVGPRDSAPSFAMVAGLGTLGALALGNYWLWQQGDMAMLAGLDAGAVVLGLTGLYLRKRYGGKKKRFFLDDKLVEEKLKSLCFWTEIQLIRIYRNLADELAAEESVDQLVDALRSYDHVAGNSLEVGKVHRYGGEEIFQQQSRQHPFLGGSLQLGWLNNKRASHTALSAKEIAGLWHPPLGTDDMAPMKRVAAGTLVPYLVDLGGIGEDAGPLVGYGGDGTQEIYLPESAIRKHALCVGKSGVGKSTMVKHILAHKLRRKAEGKDDGAIVVIDPHADLVRDILQVVPPSIAHKVRLLDFGRNDRIPAINLMDPEVFTDRDRCADTIVQTVKHLWEHWGGRLEDLLKRSLLILYEYNTHPDTPRSEMLTMLDILALLDEGKEVGSGRNVRTEMNSFQAHVMGRVSDPSLKRWFANFLGWSRDTRSEAMGPVQSRMGAYASDRRAKVVLGQQESTIFLKDVLREGQVLLASTAQGTIGVQPAALMGGTLVSLVESALREQENLPPSQRSRCLLVCDEFQTVTGAPWENLLAEIRKYGGSLLLSTQSLVRLDTGERRLKAGILGNTGCFIGYQMSADDARIVAAEMDDERVKMSYLVNLDPHCAYVRINSDTKCFPAFSIKTLPPPDMTGGSQECVDAVVAAMGAYTNDFQEALLRVDAHAEAMLDRSKANMDDVGLGDGAGAKRSNSYKMLLDEPAGGVEAPAALAGAAAAKSGGDPGLDLITQLLKDAPLGKEAAEAEPVPVVAARGGSGGGVGVAERPVERNVERPTGADGPRLGAAAEVAPETVPAEAPVEAPVVVGDVPTNGGADRPENGGGGGSAPSAGSGADVKSPRPKREMPADRVQEGSLRGIHQKRVEASEYNEGVLEFLGSLNVKDPAVRQVLDKHLGDRLDSEKRKLTGTMRREIASEAGDKRETEMRETMEREFEERWKRNEAKLREEVRAEEVGRMVGTARAERDVGQLRRSEV